MKTLADRYRAFLLDLDGVLYRGDEAVPGAAEAVEALRARGRVVFVTNNSARTPARVAEKLRDLGIAAEADEVVTSAQAVAPLIVGEVGHGATVFVIGEEGVREALHDAGLKVLDGAPERADAVVVGWDRGADYEKLRVASVLVGRGARLFATNADASYPAPGGELWPGAGALLAAIETATGARAIVAGKPHPPLFREALVRAGTDAALVVGDRIETDVAGAAVAGLDAALVWSGAAAPADLLDHDLLPALVARDLRDLVRPRAIFRERPVDRGAVRRLVRDAGLTDTPGEAAEVLLEDEEGPAATAAVQVLDGVGYLHSVASREDARGSGAGTLAVAAAAREARVRGATSLVLLTEDADGFFARLGFEKVTREDLPRWALERATACSASAVAMARSLPQA